MAYFKVLAGAYRGGDLSVAYPLMRGLPPLVVAVSAIVVFGEALSPMAWLAMLVLLAGVLQLGWEGLRAGALNARYHVLGGTLSPLDGVGPAELTIDALVSRAHDPEVKEIVLALNATVDGQTTAHYVTDLLQDANVKVTRLAHGVPVGGELDYLDEGTLSAAMRQRTLF